MTTCHKPNCTALSCQINGKPTVYCVLCDRELLPDAPNSAVGLTEYVERADPNAWEGSEKKLVDAIRRAVMARGGFMFRVAQRGGFGSGTEEGCPDTFISIAGKRDLFKGVEIKPAYAVVKPAQKRWVCKGLTVVVRSVERALEVCGYEE